MARKKTTTTVEPTISVENEMVTPVEVSTPQSPVEIDTAAEAVKESKVEEEEKAEEKREVRLKYLMNIRKAPSKSAPILTTLPAGTILTVLEQLPTGWLHVADPNAYVLYEDGKYGELLT